MRILIVSQYYYPEVFPSTLIAEELALRGHEVDVVTGKPNYGLNPIPKEYDRIKEEDIHGVHVHRLSLHKRGEGALSLVLNYLSFWRNVKRFFKKLDKDYDIVYGFNFSPIVSLDGAGEFAKRKKIPYVINVYDLWPESVVATGMAKKGSFLYRNLFNISKRIYSESDYLLLSSPGFEDYFKNVIGIDKPSKTVYQPLQEKEGVVYESPFKEGEKPLVYCGNLGRLQDLRPYIRAMANLSDRKDLRFYIIGEGNEKKTLEELASSLKVEDRVFFLGHLAPEAALAYRRNAFLNVVSLKSDNSPVGNTIPTKLIAAFGDARPILATVFGDGGSLLKEAGGSFLSAMDDGSVSDNIEKALSLSKEEWQSMGERNRAFYESHFEADKVVDKIESVLLNLTK